MNAALTAYLRARALAGELGDLPLVGALGTANAGEPAISIGGPGAPTLASELSTANIFAVGHSLISHTDSRAGGRLNIPGVLAGFATEAGLTHGAYQHNFAGAPLRWNWGGTAPAWANVGTSLQELVDAGGGNYGTYDTLVCTEGSPVESAQAAHASSFFLRRFCGAALNANPACRLFHYETWPHFQASDQTNFAAVYGAEDDFDFLPYGLSEQAIWSQVALDAADPALTAAAPGDYTWQGSGSDPGIRAGTYTINVIPGGTALRALIARLIERRSGDDWTFSDAHVGSEMKVMDLFQNPHTGFPGDLSTTALGGAVDDIHQSAALAYFIACVWYACIYRRSPVGLSTANNIEAPIAAIMQEVAWDTAVADPRTGVTV